jgi:hypothetical protein
MSHLVDDAAEAFQAGISKGKKDEELTAAQRKLTCPKCGQIFRDPVRIVECGHTFCQRCIWPMPLDATEGGGRLNVKIGQNKVEHLRMEIAPVPKDEKREGGGGRRRRTATIPTIPTKRRRKK